MDDVRAVEQVLIDYFEGVNGRNPEWRGGRSSRRTTRAPKIIDKGKVLEGRDRIRP